METYTLENNLTTQVIPAQYEGKLQSIAEFRKSKNVSNQAIAYAIRNGHLDYIQVDKVRLIVLTENTLRYRPNPSPKRVVREKIQLDKASNKKRSLLG